MFNKKFLGIDGLPKDFYETFWEDIKDIFINPLKQIEINVILSISQRQLVIKRLEKKDQDNRFTKNWKPTLMLNVNKKILSKAFATKFKSILPSII